MKGRDDVQISMGRHAAECKICAHPLREEIERDFVNWRSPAAITKHYKLTNRASVYRHAHALALFLKRQRNVRAALEKIIERAGEAEVNAAAVVSAVSAYARINSAGQWVERSERIDLNQLFDKMSATELEEYARDGTPPDWFTGATDVATGGNGRNESRGSKVNEDTRRSRTLDRNSPDKPPGPFPYRLHRVTRRRACPGRSQVAGR